MGFLMKDSKLIATHYLLCKGAILLALLRQVLSWALKLRNRAAAITLFSLASRESLLSRSPPPSSSSLRASSDIVGDGLPLATYGDAVAERLRASCDTCAVCFSPLMEGEEVRVLRNCRHVYHRECLDGWVGCDSDHGRDRPGDRSNHRTCPLCRAPLWGPPPSRSLRWDRTEPRWSVKRLCSSVWGCDL
ncbi:RING-H2 finger protein ATL5 [Rhodamnia argentea]|uniref:RING-H2 finger protein ATL5 n=1 Tax=Rhodamnia argentea TaxID=178133 RepID=A0A8B8P922_9MYRT|nr:RING-H2 finger protein ATL5 [Rhodamnia argentea]